VRRLSFKNVFAACGFALTGTVSAKPQAAKFSPLLRMPPWRIVIQGTIEWCAEMR
jgi:hypothetical protein